MALTMKFLTRKGRKINIQNPREINLEMDQRFKMWTLTQEDKIVKSITSICTNLLVF